VPRRNAGSHRQRDGQFDCVAGLECSLGDAHAFDSVDPIRPYFARRAFDRIDEKVPGLRATQGVGLDQARGALVAKLDEKMVGAGEADLLERRASRPTRDRGRRNPLVDRLPHGRHRLELFTLFAAKPPEDIVQRSDELLNRRKRWKLVPQHGLPIRTQLGGAAIK
jgi:hypothetical protein